ncbi:MAG TPA: Tol-Pal system beta propeller repeat protein TolB [Marinospirillum sp.]|uniref:Tol-Pal system beta propeller repeat protein TolB n=1 Tax=Marinospirillum sp. TaxID=2183934 RepID=UPI002B46C808|nr:Tol-Pal system beta propeller repeat protein TolB [Marinospirillum sp.]HKM15338.1 Tol-Pal system beta propeller repeat protein TolB [Marinospirillum sp.]
MINLSVIKSRHFFATVMLVFALLLSSLAQANLSIRITKGSDQAIPIAIVPFSWSGLGGLDQDVASIIGANFTRTGLFRTLPREDLVSLPTKGSQVVYRDWRLLKVNYLVIGSIESLGGQQIRINYELFDVANQERLLAENVTGKVMDLRRQAHLISDRIYERLTGQQGIFSTKIAYVTAKQQYKSVNYRLHVADADGQRSRSILSSIYPLLSIDWSPDGKKLAYVSFETGRPAIFIHELATGKRIQLTNFQGLNGAPSWSPDGKKIAMTLSRDGNAEIYIYHLDNPRLTRVTQHYAIDTEPSWSPDGKSIIFTSDRSGGPQVYRINLASGEEGRVSFDGNYNARPRYSPDGKEIFMMHRPSGGGLFGIAALNMSTGRTRVLSTSPLDHSPSVSPNGAMVIYALMRGEKGVLGVVSTDGRIQYELPAESGDVLEPAWSPYLK